MDKVIGLFFKQYHSILKLKLTDKRKMILCALMSTYERFFEEELEYKGIKYHFYFNQKDLYDALGMAQRTFEYNLKWLKGNGYINFETANKQGYLCRTTYFYISSDIINLVVPQESKDSKNNENAEQKLLTPTKEIEQEITASTGANEIPKETIEIKEVSISTENYIIPTKAEEIEQKITVPTETNIISTETTKVITEPTEEDINFVVISILKYMKGVLKSASIIHKTAINELKKILIEYNGFDTVKKAMFKCLDDGWFILVDWIDNSNFYNIQNRTMLYNITFEDLEELNYSELYNKAKK